MPKKETSMKLNAASLLSGFCMALMAIAARPAEARSNTAFSAHHIENPLDSNAYTCVTEDNGAVFNNCKYNVSLEFDLPIDTPGSKTVDVRDFFNGTNAQNTFPCVLYAYSGMQGNSIQSPTIFFTSPRTLKSTTVNVPEGWNIQLICWNIPPGGGIASLDWNQ